MKNKKALTLRLQKELWVFLKKDAIDKEMSLNEFIVYQLNKYKDKIQNKLT